MRHGSLYALAGRHGTTVSGAARVQGSFDFTAIALGAASGLSSSRVYVLGALIVSAMVYLAIPPPANLNLTYSSTSFALCQGNANLQDGAQERRPAQCA